MKQRAPDAFERQFHLEPADYLAGLDFFTWTRHFHLFKDLAVRVRGRVLEVGTGDGVLRRCVEPHVAGYVVVDVNARLSPDVVADVRELPASLNGGFDAVVAAEVLEHLPFADFPRSLASLAAALVPGGLLFLTLPHRKGHVLWVGPRQRLHAWRFPVGLLSLSEAYHRFVRRRIWIDPHHCWEIGDGHVRRADVESAFAAAGLAIDQRRALPYCDYWILRRGAA